VPSQTPIESFGKHADEFDSVDALVTERGDEQRSSGFEKPPLWVVCHAGTMAEWVSSSGLALSIGTDVGATLSRPRFSD